MARWTVFAVAALMLWTLPASAAELDLQRWLDEPDVKLVVVEFYADWCEPCKAAAPKWEALRKKYAPDGLKLVVVNLSKQAAGDGRCSQLPWNPDESLCDPALGERLGVKNLPEAFVWSWQGNLLVERGQHVGEIETVIRRYLDDNPRVQVVATNRRGKSDRKLRRQVQGRLTQAGKLTVVPDAEMRKRLASVRRESHVAAKRDDQRCALGAEVSANSLLSVERFEGSLSLTLTDAESGCQRAAVTLPWDARRVEKTLDKAVYKLVLQLKQRVVKMPALQTSLPGEPRTEARRVGVPVHVMFNSEPPRATVSLDGRVVCPSTPCRAKVPRGRYQVGMHLEGHVLLEREVLLDAGQILGWSLEPEVHATVKFVSVPPGATVSVDGLLVCRSTPCHHTVLAGSYQVLMTLKHHVSVERTVVVDDKKSIGWALDVDPSVALLTLRSNVSNLPVFIDGVQVGLAPLEHLSLSPGEYSVGIGEGRCQVVQTVEVMAGQSKYLEVDGLVVSARLRVTATGVNPQDWLNARRHTVSAMVYVDGNLVGNTLKVGGDGEVYSPTFKVSVCAKNIEVRNPAYEVWTSETSFVEGKLADIKADFRLKD